MLNIYKLKKKENLPKLKDKLGDVKGKVKNTIPANKEWYNSIYVFNKNSIKLLPITDNVITKIIKTYFNMFNIVKKEKKEKKEYKGLNILAIKNSAIKVWISRPEIKHANNKLIITFYIYNKKLYELTNKYKNANVIYDKIIYNKEIYDEKTYLKLIQNMLFNKFKYNVYISGIREILHTIYRKNIEFNLVSLKNYFLNSNILSQIINLKLRNKKNNPAKILKASMRKIKTPVLNDRTVKRVTAMYTEAKNLTARNYFLYKNNLPYWYITRKSTTHLENKSLEDLILKNTKNKLLSGITLKTSGRITKRIVAERARYKIRSLGTLKNINSSFKGLSSVTVRGFKRSNIENTLLRSKTHVGAFGTKGWVSSY